MQDKSCAMFWMISCQFLNKADKVQCQFRLWGSFKGQNNSRTGFYPSQSAFPRRLCHQWFVLVQRAAVPSDSTVPHCCNMLQYLVTQPYHTDTTGCRT